jgi:hypothetical protein
MNELLCLVMREKDDLSIQMPKMDTDHYEAVAAIVLSSALGRGASLQRILETLRSVTLSERADVPEPLVIG